MPDEEELSVDEKCADMPHDMGRPYGGATSFDELDAQRAVMEYASKIDSETYTLETLIGNITNSPDLSPGDKAAAISRAAADYKTRVDSIQSQAKESRKQLEGNKGFWDSFVSLVTGSKRNYSTEQRHQMAQNGQAMSDGSFPIADVADLKNAIQSIGRASNRSSAMAHIKKRARALGKADMLPEDWKELSPSDLPENRGFKVYRDKEGKLRWLSLSSNAFEDLDNELFTTKALQEAIERADKSGSRGPLLLYHVPSAEIGQCDFQGLAGRFLVESGTFDDTPLGQKAVEYFVNSDEEHQVSIGFQYESGDEEDGVFDWLDIIERSVTPYGAAANPWTDFKIVGENPMEERKANWLKQVFGDEISEKVIAEAEARTKELEASTKFKETTEETVDETSILAALEKAMSAEDMQAAMAKMPDGPQKDAMKKRISVMSSKKEEKAEETKEEEESKEAETEAWSAASASAIHVVEGVTPQQLQDATLTKVAALLVDISGQIEELSGLKSVVEQLQTEVKEIKKSDEEKMAQLMEPRWSFPGGIRPTDSNRNVIEEEKAKEMVGAGEEDETPNPAQAYVDDLLGRNGRLAVG